MSVDYSDILRITLPHNRHHFGEVWIVTTPGSDDGRVAREHGAKVFETNLFTAAAATFNKWRALEAGLDAMGREGWLCIMDADVLWPKDIYYSEWHGALHWRRGEQSGNWCSTLEHPDERRKRLYQEPRQLCTPLRRMWENWPQLPSWIPRLDFPVPHEAVWQNFPLHRQQREFAGFTQIFHASDPVLGPPPWHQIDWKHAGGADSFFQAKWPEERKVRPPFECLHLGPAGANWWGRATPRADGTVPPDAADKARMTSQIWSGRAERRRRGLEPFGPERIG